MLRISVRISEAKPDRPFKEAKKPGGGSTPPTPGLGESKIGVDCFGGIPIKRGGGGEGGRNYLGRGHRP